MNDLSGSCVQVDEHREQPAADTGGGGRSLRAGAGGFPVRRLAGGGGRDGDQGGGGAAGEETPGARHHPAR